jgi:Eukaryotic protein of unknown function (DUF842)
MSTADEREAEESVHFKDRLNRCAMQCQDQIKDKVTPDTKEGEFHQFQAQMDKCVAKCADDHIALLPSMLKKAQDMIQKTTQS